MPDGLHLNGRFYDRLSLIETAPAKLADINCPAWEKSFWHFLSEWFYDESLLVVKTSGSTGDPKPLRIRKDFFVNSARMTLDYLDIAPGATALLCLSTDYIAAKMMLVRAVVGRLKLRVIPPQVDRILHEGLKTDFCAMVPLQVQTILNRPDGMKQLGQIRCLLIGGAPISPELEARLAGLGNRIYATYGMTETVSHIALRRLSGAERSPSYRILPGISIKMDENNCLIIDAPSLTDGPIHTTDIVRMVNDREFDILGRRDNIINSGGIKFSPETIEKKLAILIPERFIISSLPDAILGNKLILIIESASRNPEKNRKLEYALKDCLTPYECPKKIVYLNVFPALPNGKLSRKTVTQAAIQTLIDS